MTGPGDPPEWADDQIMGVLFAPFRDSRDVNPSSWDRKLQFWTRLIIQKHSLEGKASFIGKQLPGHFERSGKIPFCLGVVVQDMIKKGHLQKLEEFQACANKSWGNWSYGIFVKKPVSFTFNWLVKKPVSWTFQQIVGSRDGSAGSPSGSMAGDSTHGLENIEYVLPEVVKKLGDEIVAVHQSSVKNPLTDTVHDLEEFRGLCGHLCRDEKSFQLAISALCSRNRCAIQDIDGVKVIVFAGNNQTVQQVSDTELRVYRLKNAERKLHEQTVVIGQEMEKNRLDAKSYLQRGMKVSAKNCLRKKKRLEAQQEKKEVAMDNIHQLLLGIQQAHTDKEVLDAYSMGVAAFKDISRGMSADKVDDVMDSVKEVLEDQDEINRSMALDNDDLDLLEELESLSDLPPVASPAPHQELIDSVCQMRIIDNFPAIPTHDPISPVIGFSSVSPERNKTSTSKVPLLNQGLDSPPHAELPDLYNLPDVPTDSPSSSILSSRESSFRVRASPQGVALPSGDWDFPPRNSAPRAASQNFQSNRQSPEPYSSARGQYWPTNSGVEQDMGNPSGDSMWDSRRLYHEGPSECDYQNVAPQSWSSPIDNHKSNWASSGNGPASKPWQPWRSPGNSDPNEPPGNFAVRDKAHGHMDTWGSPVGGGAYMSPQRGQDQGSPRKPPSGSRDISWMMN